MTSKNATFAVFDLPISLLRSPILLHWRTYFSTACILLALRSFLASCIDFQISCGWQNSFARENCNCSKELSTLQQLQRLLKLHLNIKNIQMSSSYHQETSKDCFVPNAKLEVAPLASHRSFPGSHFELWRLCSTAGQQQWHCGFQDIKNYIQKHTQKISSFHPGHYESLQPITVCLEEICDIILEQCPVPSS